MARAAELTGQRFGKLTVIERAENSRNGKARWLCRCDCGGETVTSGVHLRSGHTLSCGCVQRKRTGQANTADLTGRRFGLLTVVSRKGSTLGGRATWRCRCDCGNETVVTGKNLLAGHHTTCGQFKHSVEDLTGRRFDRWVVLGRADNRPDGSTRWHCRCDCGNEALVDRSSLILGTSRSCGCIRIEELVERNTVHGQCANGSYYGYPSGWTDEFREAVRARDGYVCQVCGKTQEEEGQALAVHHIDYDRDNTTMENCIALCHSCHSKTNYDREYWTELFQWYMARREEAQ